MTRTLALAPTNTDAAAVAPNTDATPAVLSGTLASNTIATRVTSIGKASRVTATLAAEVVAATPADYDWTARGAVPKAIDAYVATGGAVPAKQKGGKGNQTLTDYGRGVDVLRKAVAALVKGDAVAGPAVMRVTLSGEGGGSAVVPADAPDAVRAYLLALIAPTDAE